MSGVRLPQAQPSNLKTAKTKPDNTGSFIEPPTLSSRPLKAN